MEPQVPADINLSDGLSEEEAVALAIANNAEFQASVAGLGVVAADIVRAQLPTNPTLSTVIGSTWEATLVAPIDYLLKRAGRIKAASANYDAQVELAVQAGLDLILTTRLAYTDALLAQRRQQIADSAAERASHVNRITASALQAGNASGLEARVTQSQAATSTQDAALARSTREIAENRLRRLTRLTEATWDGGFTPAATPVPSSIDTTFLVQYAIDHRPDIKGAALQLEAAGARIGLARVEALNLAAGVKLTGDGANRDTRPAFDLALPVFNWGQADRLAAESQARQAAFLYAASRERVTQEVRDAAIDLQQASKSLRAWRDTIVPELDETVRRTERAYAAGDIPYLTVLDNLQRLIDAQRAQADAEAGMSRSVATLARHVGGAMPEDSSQRIVP